MRAVLLFSYCLILWSCSDPAPTLSDVVPSTDDTVASSDTSDTHDVAESETSDTPMDAVEPSYSMPDYFPGTELPADEVKVLSGLKEPVRVVEDTYGVPHIYAKTIDDLLFAQGYVTASKRLFQMHTLRMAASGRLGELLGPESVQGDVFLRVLKLRATAEKMALRTQELYPEVYKALEDYAAGVNRFLERMEAGHEPKPLEVILFKSKLEPWSPSDTLTIVRLQTWDLGFGGVFSEDELLERILTLRKTFKGSSREGIEDDVYRFTPPAQTPTVIAVSYTHLTLPTIYSV